MISVRRTIFRGISFALCLPAVLAMVPAAGAETHDVVTAPGFRFSPQNITIQVGDTVRWTNAGGSHNVSADDNSFRCANGCDDEGGNGAASADSWVVARTFTEADVIDYHCDPHQGLGMVGQITVEGTVVPDPEPGEIVMVSSPIAVDEGDGQVNVDIRRQNGKDGAVTVQFATANGTATAGQDYTAASGMIAWADGDDADKQIAVTIIDDDDTENNETFNVNLSTPTGDATLGAQTSSLVRIFDDDVTATVCVPGETTLCLGENDRFKVEVTFETTTEPPRLGNTIDFGQRDSGLFWFFEESNAELLVKVLNVCGGFLNNRYWVFFAATTNVQFDLVVTDTEAGQAKTYSNAQGVAALPIQDIEAFDTCPPL